MATKKRTKQAIMKAMENLIIELNHNHGPDDGMIIAMCTRATIVDQGITLGVIYKIMGILQTLNHEWLLFAHDTKRAAFDALKKP